MLASFKNNEIGVIFLFLLKSQDKLLAVYNEDGKIIRSETGALIYKKINKIERNNIQFEKMTKIINEGDVAGEQRYMMFSF